jgi:transmembrane sensor
MRLTGIRGCGGRMVETGAELGTRTSIQRQARMWLIRMDSDEPLTDAEKRALEEWLTCSAAHRRELVRLSTFWNHANILTELIAGLEARGRERSWIRATLMAAGAVLVSVDLVYCCLQSLGGSVTRAYGTAIGEQESIALSDGSSIQLNTDSQVRVVYSSTARSVRLLRGEAFFSVTYDPNRVFALSVAGSTVRAIGTAFVVHVKGRRVDVTVAKGMVDISDVGPVDSGSVKAPAPTSEVGRLRAGEVASFDSGSGRVEVHQVAHADLQRRLAWQEGYLSFAGEPLSEVVTQLNRYSTTTLLITDPKLASIAIGGSFRIGDRDALLDLLSKTS